MREEDPMNLKKIMLLALMALCAGALAAPATASAEAFWTEEGFFLEENAEIELNGNFEFETALGGIDCEVNGMATLEPGESGKLTAFTLKAATCEGFGLLEACEVTETEAAGLPMTIHADTTTAIQVTNVFFIYEVEGMGCPVEAVSINSPKEVFFTPANAEEMKILSVGGVVTTSLGGMQGESAGELIVNPGATYGIWSEF